MIGHTERLPPVTSGPTTAQAAAAAHSNKLHNRSQWGDARPRPARRTTAPDVTLRQNHSLGTSAKATNDPVQQIMGGPAGPAHLARRFSARQSSSNSAKMKPKVVGDWVFGRTIGAGSAGKVKLAHHIRTGQVSAVKIVSRSTHGDSRNHDDARNARAVREAALGLLMNHPYICSIYDVVLSPSHFYIFFEYIDGGQMLDYIISHGKLSEKQARKFIRQIASALDYLHRNCIVHRDLKIENILVDHYGNMKLIDFGLSNMYDSRSHLSTFCGSLYFAAPELLSAKPYIGPEIDFWSFGVVLYVLVCGKVPFDDQSMPALHEKIKAGNVEYPPWMSSECKHLLSRMLDINPRKRATLYEVMTHPWMNKGYDGPPHNYMPDRQPISMPVSAEVVRQMCGFRMERPSKLLDKLVTVINSEEYQNVKTFSSDISTSYSSLEKKKPFLDYFRYRKTVSMISGSSGSISPGSCNNFAEENIQAGRQLAPTMSQSYHIDDSSFHPLVSLYHLTKEKHQMDVSQNCNLANQTHFFKFPDIFELTKLINEAERKRSVRNAMESLTQHSVSTNEEIQSEKSVEPTAGRKARTFSFTSDELKNTIGTEKKPMQMVLPENVPEVPIKKVNGTSQLPHPQHRDGLLGRTTSLLRKLTLTSKKNRRLSDDSQPERPKSSSCKTANSEQISESPFVEDLLSEKITSPAPQRTKSLAISRTNGSPILEQHETTKVSSPKLPEKDFDSELFSAVLKAGFFNDDYHSSPFVHSESQKSEYKQLQEYEQALEKAQEPPKKHLGRPTSAKNPPGLCPVRADPFEARHVSINPFEKQSKTEVAVPERSSSNKAPSSAPHATRPMTPASISSPVSPVTPATPASEKPLSVSTKSQAEKDQSTSANSGPELTTNQFDIVHNQLLDLVDNNRSSSDSDAPEIPPKSSSRCRPSEAIRFEGLQANRMIADQMMLGAATDAKTGRQQIKPERDQADSGLAFAQSGHEPKRSGSMLTKLRPTVVNQRTLSMGHDQGKKFKKSVWAMKSAARALTRAGADGERQRSGSGDTAITAISASRLSRQMKQVSQSGLFSTDTTSRKSPEVILSDLKQVLQQLSIKFYSLDCGFQCVYWTNKNTGHITSSQDAVSHASSRSMIVWPEMTLTDSDRSLASVDDSDEINKHDPLQNLGPALERLQYERKEQENKEQISSQEMQQQREQQKQQVQLEQNQKQQDRNQIKSVTRISTVKFEVYIVKVTSLSMYGLQFKKIVGDTWLYQSIAGKILSELKL